MITIDLDNSQGRISAPANVLRQVRPLVAYREQELPPIPVQHTINSFMARKRRWGMREDTQRIHDHPEVGARLKEMGWGPERLTPRLFEAVMRMRGVWDGWTTLISPGGYFGAGLVQHVERALSLRLGHEVEVVDRRARPAPQPMGKCPRPDLFGFQQEAVEAWFAKGCRGVIDLPPRSGKTHIAIAIVIELGLPALVVVPTRELVKQTARRFRDYLHASDVVEVTGGRPSPKKQRRMNHALVWIATPPTAAGPKPKGRTQRRPGVQGIQSRKVLIIDEFHHCFHPETMVATDQGDRPIAAIREGEQVLTLTRNGETGYRRVTRTWVRKAPQTMLLISTDIGVMEVTRAHRIYTDQGQRTAGDLRVGDRVRGIWPQAPQGCDLHMPLVRQGGQSFRAEGSGAGAQRASVLHRCMPGQLSQLSVVSDDGSYESGVCVGSDVAAQCAQDNRGASKDHSGHSASNPRRPDDAIWSWSRGQWASADPLRGSGAASAGPMGIPGGGDRPDQSGASAWRAADSLQDRCGPSRPDDCRGDRWLFPFRKGGSGRKEGRFSGKGWVDGAEGSVAVACRGYQMVGARVLAISEIQARCTTVHDLEVADTHRYFAEGHLVSNSAANTWQDISMAATEAYYRLGLTGTHFRADGKDLAMHAVLSRCVYRRTVSEMVAAGRLVPAKVAMVRMHGAVDASGHDLYAEGVVDHPYRNGLIAVAANWLTHLGCRVLVITKEIRHAEALAAAIDGAVQVDGRDNSILSGVLGKLAAGVIRCVVGTSVIGEGVDVPEADALVYAAGGRSPVKHKQDYFRVLTASPGKQHGIIVDFADIHHPKLEDAAAQRFGLYRSEDAFSAEVVAPDDLPTWLQGAVR